MKPTVTFEDLKIFIAALFGIVVGALTIIRVVKEFSFGKTLGRELKKRLGVLEKENYEIRNSMLYIEKDRAAVRNDLERRLSDAKEERHEFEKRMEGELERSARERQLIKEDLADLETAHDTLYQTLFNKFLK